MEVTVDELMVLIGKKEVELVVLRTELAKAQARIRDLTAIKRDDQKAGQETPAVV